MSRSYPDRVACPYCGLIVAANLKKGRLRSHAARARDEAPDSPCVRDGFTARVTVAPPSEPDPDSNLPRHLR